MKEAEIHKTAILSKMGEWFIAELVDGKISGAGYGGNIEACVPDKMGHMVILRNRKEIPKGSQIYICIIWKKDFFRGTGKCC